MGDDYPPVAGADVDFDTLREKDPEEMLEMGMRWWSKDEGVMLLPHAWREDIPDDFRVVTINGEKMRYGDERFVDQRRGLLACGIEVDV